MESHVAIKTILVGQEDEGGPIIRCCELLRWYIALHTWLTHMRDGLNASGRAIYFSVTEALPFVDGHPRMNCYGENALPPSCGCAPIRPSTRARCVEGVVRLLSTAQHVSRTPPPRQLANSYLVE